MSADEFFPRGDRYDGLRACIGQSTCLQLHKLRVFMVRRLFFVVFLSRDGSIFVVQGSHPHCKPCCPAHQVGCGAIGCEMLKNLALLGVGLAKSSGEVAPPPLSPHRLTVLHCPSTTLLCETYFTEHFALCRSISGVHHRSRPYREVQPQSSISLQTTSHTGKQVCLRSCLVLWVSSHVGRLPAAIFQDRLDQTPELQS